MSISRARFRLALVVLVIASLIRIAWLLKDGADRAVKVEAAIYALLLGLLTLFLFYPTARGPSDSN